MRIVFSWLLVFVTFSGWCQEQIGLNPPSMKWMQIEGGFGKVIFPVGMDSSAFRIASLMEFQNVHDSSIIGDVKTRRVPVIMQNQSTLPAGFSTPAPWRNELYLSYPQNPFMGPTMWTDVLTIHEYRHTQQFDMARGGITLPWKILMGQTGWLLNALMLQPLWFREGDATYAETIYSKGGRGRLPSFHMEYRALRLAGYDYNYEKAHFYSYKDFIPNPYRLGYYMVNKVRNDHGVDVWSKVLYDTHYKKGFIYPLSRSLKDLTGMGTKDLYQATMIDLDSLFEKTDAELDLTPSETMTEEQTKTYTNYRYPHYLEDGSIVALKSGFDLIRTYYQMSDGKEMRLFSPGVYTEDHATTVIEGNLMAWAESSFHERWVNKDYSIVKVYDFRTGKTRKISGKSRYFMPAPSHDGKLIAVHETDEFNRFFITILNAEDGEVIRKLPVPSNKFITHLRWMGDNRSLVALSITTGGNSIVKIDSETGGLTTILSETEVPVTRPFPWKDYVLFSGGYTGIDNIYAVKISSGEVFRITSVRFGAYEPVVSPDGSKILYAAYTADGYKIREMDLNVNEWERWSGKSETDILFHKKSYEIEGKDLSHLEVDTTYQVEKYNSWTSGLFNIYGWFPIPSPPEYGLEFYTRNIMSTLRGTLGVTYNTNEDQFRYFAHAEYAALYPIIDVGFQHGRRRSDDITDVSEIPEYYEQEWRENVVSAGLKFPFKLTQGTHHTRLTLGGYYEYYDVDALDSSDVSIVTADESFDGWKGELEFFRLRETARQQVKPRWGQVVNLRYQEAIDENPMQFKAVTNLFFPGFTRNHSFNFAGRYKKEEVVNTYRYVDDFMMPRGYLSAPFEEIYVLGANYELPLWYPDLSLGSVAFFQRLRGELFFDYSKGTIQSFEQNMNSTGAQLYIDMRLFRLFQMTMAFRFNYVLDDDYFGETTPFEFLITSFELAN